MFVNGGIQLKNFLPSVWIYILKAKFIILPFHLESVFCHMLYTTVLKAQ